MSEDLLIGMQANINQVSARPRTFAEARDGLRLEVTMSCADRLVGVLRLAMISILTVVYIRCVVALSALLSENEFECRRSARGERLCRLEVRDDRVFDTEILEGTRRGYETSTNHVDDDV